ncbi:MAG: hypothetical protein R6X02_29795 [Enhygromyxa sp.]
MPDVTPTFDWVRLGHRAIVVYGVMCLLAGCVVLFHSAGLLGLLVAPVFLMTPEIVLAWLAGPLAFGLGHWIGDRVTKRQEGHVVARMLSRNAQSVHGTAIVLGTCSYYPLVLPADQDGMSIQPVLMLGLALFAQAVSASAHTARRRGRPLVAASVSAATYAAIGVLIGVFSRAMWIGAFALPFAVYFAATALWLVRGPRWDDA